MKPILVDGAFVSARWPARPFGVHKGDNGRALLICGSVGYTGAARMAAESCLRVGTGLVSLGVPRAVYPIVAAAVAAEIMCFPLPDDADGRLSADALAPILARAEKADAVLVGPGLGRSDALDRLTAAVTDSERGTLVVDADGLNSLAGHIFVKRTSPLVLTPHEGEFQRLGGRLSEGREKAALAMAEQTGAIVVLKGPGTVTAAPDGRCFLNTSGGPGMAKGGSGDVLAGMVTGLLAQRAANPALWTSDEATLTAMAVCLHGLAGDRAAARLGVYAMGPSDMIREIPAGIGVNDKGKDDRPL